MNAQTRTTRNLDPKQVAERAYQIWEGSGRPFGREIEHWLKAEAELLAAQSASKEALGNNTPESTTTEAHKRAVASTAPEALKPAGPVRAKSREGRPSQAVAA